MIEGSAPALDHLVSVIRMLSATRDVEGVAAVVRDAARKLTRADGATFVLRDGDDCFYAAENAIRPLWQGQRFPMDLCISGWVMSRREAAVIEDIELDPRIPQDLYQPTFVRSMVMVPIRRDAPIGAIGNYWATQHRATPEEVTVLQALADTTAVALENARLSRDLSARMLTLREQEARLAAQRDKLEAFSRALAHDLREPVRTLRSYLRLLDRSGRPAEASYLRYLEAAAERIHMLLDSVSRYTELEDDAAVATAPCSMRAALDAACANLEASIRETGATIRIGELPTVDAAPARITQLWQNLLANALHHGRAPTGVEIEARPMGAEWLFSVRDDGPGIPADHLQDIFRPFTRLGRDAGRAGLGLAACGRIVAAHGGRIWCESESGRGATFFFTLPLGAAAPATAAPPGTAEAASVDEEPDAGEHLANVLLVDDDEPDITLARLLLFERPKLVCNVDVARDGEAALAHLEEAHRRGQPVDLILLDINLPGDDGFQVLARIRQSHWGMQVPTILCSGSSSPADKRRAESLHAVGYLEKPPRSDEFESMIARVASLLVRPGPGQTRLLRALRPSE